MEIFSTTKGQISELWQQSYQNNYVHTLRTILNSSCNKLIHNIDNVMKIHLHEYWNILPTVVVTVPLITILYLHQKDSNGHLALKVNWHFQGG